MDGLEFGEVFEAISVIRHPRTNAVLHIASGIALFGSAGSIRAYSPQGILLYAFASQHQPILQLSYLPALDAVVSLEGEGTLVVYRNWRVAPRSTLLRAALLSQDPARTDLPSSLCAAELAVLGVSALATDVSAARLAVVVAPTTVLLVDVSPALHLDVALEVNTTCAPNSVALFERYLVFASQREVVALSLSLLAANHTKAASETAPAAASEAATAAAAGDSALDDEARELDALQAPRFVECRFDLDTSLASTLYLPSVRPSPVSADAVFEVRGPTAPTDLTVALRNTARYTAVRTTLQLHRRFPLTAVVTGLCMVPEYAAEIALDAELQAQAVRCVVSTTDASYLYNLSRPALMCMYPHSVPALQVACTSSLLCAISSHGLDVWILRTQQGLSAHGRALPPWKISDRLMAGLAGIAVDDELVALLSMPPTEDQPDFGPEQGGLTARSVTAGTDAGDTMSLTLLALASAATLAAAASTAAGRAGTAGTELAALADARHILLGAPVGASPLESGATALVTARLRRRNRRVALRRAAGRLATCVLRTGDCASAAVLFAASDRPVGEVFRALQAHPAAVDATLRYLDAVLFDPSMQDVVQDDSAINTEVLQFYANHAPERLSLVVLESSLPVPPNQALLLLGQVMARGTPAPADQFAKALLLLNTRRFDEAACVLRALPDSALVEFVASNPQLLVRPDAAPLSASGLAPPAGPAPGRPEIFSAPPTPQTGGALSAAAAVAAAELEAAPSMPAAVLAVAPVASPAAATAEAPAAGDGPMETVSVSVPAAGSRPSSGVDEALTDDPLSTASDDAPASIGEMLLVEAPWLLLEALLRMRSSLSVGQALQALRRSFSHSTLTETYLECCVRAALDAAGDGRAASQPPAGLETADALANVYVQRLAAAVGSDPVQLDDAAAAARRYLVGLKRSATLRWLPEPGSPDIFGSRLPWLNHLPPFVGPGSVSAVCVELQHRLQSLLCTGRVSDPLAVSRRLGRLPPFAGRETLRLLCALQVGLVRECVVRLVRAPPAVLAAFARRHCRSEDEWRVALQALAAAATASAPGGVGSVAGDVYVEAVRDAAAALSPEALLRALPAEANVSVHLPVLLSALRKSKADTARTQALSETLRASVAT